MVWWQRYNNVRRMENDFEKFYEDVGDIPFENAELDRIDNNKGYEPDNVRWVDHKTNSNNRRKYKIKLVILVSHTNKDLINTKHNYTKTKVCLLRFIRHARRSIPSIFKSEK